MSRHLYGGWVADAQTKGIRLIGYDRPGYGGSTARPMIGRVGEIHDWLLKHF
jgi:hypothetical protein